MTLFPSHSKSPCQWLAKSWVHNQVWDNETERYVYQVAVGVAFLAVKERTQKQTVHFLPLLTRMSCLQQLPSSCCQLRDGDHRKRWAALGPLQAGGVSYERWQMSILFLPIFRWSWSYLKGHNNFSTVYVINLKKSSHPSSLTRLYVSTSDLLTVGFSVWRTTSAHSGNSGNIYWMNKCPSHGNDRWTCNKKSSDTKRCLINASEWEEELEREINQGGSDGCNNLCRGDNPWGYL